MSKFLFGLLMIPFICMADCSSELSFCYHTKLGVLEQITHANSGDDYSYLTLNGVKIYKAKTDYMSNIYDDTGFFEDKKYIVTKTVITFISNVPCTHKEYYGYCSFSVVLDFSGNELVISNEFTPDSGNSVIDWVSWGKANAIIAFEDGSKFKYMNGRVESVSSN